MTGACGSAERAMELVRAGASMKAMPIILWSDLRKSF
jgi:hypothetical protein